MLPPLPRCSGWTHSSLKLAHPYQPSPKPLSRRPAHRPFRGLLGVHSRCGLHTRAVTKIATVIRRLQTFRHLHACSGCFRLERSPGGTCTRWKSAALSRRTWIAEIRTGFLRELSDCSCIIGTAANSPKYALISANFVTIQAGAPMVGQGGEGRRSCVPRICPFSMESQGLAPLHPENRVSFL